MTDGQTEQCVVCGGGEVRERTRVRSNVRVFRDETFDVWRCDRCGSLHASEEVDLAYYYARYPFFALPVDWRMRIMYRNQARRLERAGVKRHHRIIDYGCGGGNFVKYLQSRGFEHVTGYDQYSERFSDPKILGDRYDCIISQDVLEHVADPHALLDRFGELVEPGGVIAVGTPNASAIDLSRPEQYVHALHLPYHRHIFSKQALVDSGMKRGWEVVRYYPTQYANTRFPFLNSAFYLYYMRLFDNTLDALIEPPKVGRLLLHLPQTLYWGLFGYRLSEETDVMAVFRRQ